ncbi:YkvA family protein [Desulfosporosinus sp. Sb-LF]|uniref:YkvA family protein n=1 Tax=Desulfosporosinus sp. Sb-LF TaxID=2560027 RepID=UPI001FB116FB|nr:YkvA family protein [Desulfosporosinus sp. Sb-LF]
MFKDWINGNCKEMPTRSHLMIVLAIVYFVSPEDGIFDYIPFAGFIDDATVAGFVISQVSIDLERYKQWKQQGDSTHETIEEIWSTSATEASSYDVIFNI